MFDITHPDLSSEITPHYDPYTGTPHFCIPDHDRWNNHGSAVASFVSAETTQLGGNAMGQLAAVSFKTKMIGYITGTRQTVLAKALHASNVMGASVIVSCAGGSLECSPSPSSGEELIVKEILDNGTVLVMPAGNGLDGHHCGSHNNYQAFYPFHPSYDDRIIIVSNTSKDDNHQFFNNGIEVTHSHFAEVDICAPGYELMGAVVTQCGNNNWPYWGGFRGTSFSSPIVAGVCALIKSINPDFTPAEIQYFIKSTADPINDEYNYQGMLGAGRINAFKAVEMAHNCEPIVIDTDEIWTEDKIIVCGIKIINDAKLTITSNVLLSKRSTIIVAQGSELIIDGGHLTSLDNYAWQGIEVWGEKNKSQIPLPGQPNAQGKVILKNGAVIENAENAITLWKKNDYSSTGGIVQADDAVFINNRRSVEFMSYQNTHPISETPLGNISYFKNCRFEVNDEYLAPAPFFAHISMWEVDGINIQSCDFINNMTNEPNTGVGILTSNAYFDILPSCSSLVTPCPENNIVPNTFQGFKYGIESFGTGANIKTICIKNAEFNGNSCGIKLRNVNNATIINSIFNVGGTTMYNAECGFNYGVGMELFNCTGFAIEENSFYKVYGDPEGYFVGTYIEETQAADQVYKNEYYGLTYGNYAVGKNWKESDTYQGLAYYCNQNTWNWQDITVAKDDAHLPKGGIQSQIGSSSLPAGNTFSNIADYHIYNDGDHLIEYFYYAPSPGNTSTSYYPARVYGVIREEVVGIQNQCPSNYGGGGSSSERDVVLTPAQKQQEEMDYATGLLGYDNVKALYDNLKDGGNTTGTLAEISSAWPSDMWQLRADLLGKSPHLSMEVLKATADKTDVLPENIIFEILAENPDELKKDELINYLEDKQNPLPEYMIDILRQVAMGSSYKTVLQRQMAHYNQVKTRAAHNIIRSLLNDTICNNNELRKWFDNIGGKRADEQIITTYMSEGNFTSALSLANMMPSLYNYNDNELDEHYYYMQMLNLQINLAQQQRTIFDLDSIEIDNLLNIADNSIGTAGAQAKGILEFAYGYHFYNCIDPEEQGMKSRKYLNTAATENIFGIEITAKPNPANAWVAFNYTLPANNPQGVIKISNLSGKEIASIPVSGKQGQQIWDIRSVKPGVYFYTLNTAGLSRHGKIVISK
ncbi:MAG: S8 family serine peptidase [Bacteroidales bacterium]|jgi:hypothetical protein|nr:S8 family serine peptidase [Bacteroidales bacterium]